jgi:SAM-dependent methyltransferase
VLELGCNVGRNLAAIRERAPDLQLAGVDINAAAIAVGVAEGLPLFEADEQFLARQPTGAFDVIFTVSVLDHIASPDLVLAEMLRVSAVGVLMLEPWIGREGKIIRSPDPGGGMVDTTPYSYSWDYDSMFARVPRRLAVTSDPYPLTDQRLAAHYHLWRAIHRHPRRAVVRALRRRPALPSNG